MTRFVILIAIMIYNIKKFIKFFKVNQTITPTPQ